MSDLLNYVKKHSPSIDRQDEIRQAILKWRKENPIEAPKNNDDDSVFEAGWQGLKANTGSLIQTVSDAIIDSGKPKDVTMEDWKADIVENSPFGWNPVVAASEFGAEIAKENGFDYFTTTLSVSPHKNSAMLNEIGEKLEEEIGVKFLYSDFKKREGYKRSIELSKQFELYRQEYCGCEFSIW